MEINRRKKITLLLIFLFSLLSISQPQSDSSSEKKIGVILDMGSLLGKTLNICITLAISDFYAVNSHYNTRISLHTRDSNGDASRAFSAVNNLLNNGKLQATLVLETSLEGKLLALFADKAKVPFFSFAWIPSSTQDPYMFQISPDETILFKGIFSLVESYKLPNVIVLYEDTIYASETIPYLVEYFNEKNILITYSTGISSLSSKDQIFEQLDKVIAVGTTAVILHMSTSLASNILLHARKLRMVNDKYTWIIADDAPNILYSMGSATIKSMEGSLSLMPYIPASYELHSFISRWKKEFDRNYPTSEARKMSVLGIWAYDVIWALAECVEKARNKTNSINSWKDDVGMSSEVAKDKVSLTGPVLSNEISRIRLNGLSGEFQFKKGKLVSKALEIVEVRGLKERRVGFWTLRDGIMKDLHSSSNSAYQYSNSGINATLWSKGFTTSQNRELSRTTDNAKRLMIAVPKGWTFTELVNMEPDLETNKTSYNGFCIEVFRTAMSALPYDYEFVTYQEPDGQSSESYNQLIDQVYYQKYDGAVADITILANRSKKVDFTLPYTDLGNGIIAKIDHKDMWIFFKPLGAFVWLTVAACFVAVGYIVWLFILLILISCYTAVLSSLLTVQQFKLASTRQFVINNMNFEDYRFQPLKTCQDYADALSRGSKNGGVNAIIDEIPYLKIFLAQYSVGYAMVASESTTNGFGFAFQKGSPVVPDLSLEIAKLREDGTLGSLEKKWFKGSSHLASPDPDNISPKILNFCDLSGLFLIGAVAYSLALGRYVYVLFREKIRVLNDYIFIIVAGGRLAMMMRYIYPRNPGWAIG